MATDAMPLSRKVWICPGVLYRDAPLAEPGVLNPSEREPTGKRALGATPTH